MASLAQMTGSLIDSGCKHIIPVRVSFNFFTKFCQLPQDEMLRNKMKYSMHKGDLVLCVNTNMFRAGDEMYTEGAKMQAYPAVTTTLVAPGGKDWDPVMMEMISNIYDMNALDIYNDPDAKQILQLIPGEPDHIRDCKELLARMPDFRFMGFSLGLAYAHPTSGDTVASSMIGGLMTVRNGPFRICTGDRVQWIFSFEYNKFDEMGRRTKAANTQKLDIYKNNNNHQINRMKATLMQNGVYDFEHFMTDIKKSQTGSKKDPGAKTTGKIPIAVIKPFFDGLLPEEIFPRDRMRIIGKAISNARPWDNVDIMICTQH